MTTYLQLDKVLEKDHTQVGLKATVMSQLNESARFPFSLVLTDDVFSSFIRHNGLDDIVNRFTDGRFISLDQKVSLFEELVEKWKSCSFPASTREDLRECFELLSIDTSNLDSLSSSSSTIITIQRSASYHDTDTVTDKLYFVRDDFDEFLDMIKTVMLGVFAPSSQAVREEQGVSGFHLALIVSTLPQVSACFESLISPSQSRMFVDSYIGFYDPTGSVSRDTFTLGVEFLKIQDTRIRSQNKVAVFDKDNNKVSLQHYISTGSSQSAPEQVILECGRLSKKVVSRSQVTTRLVFVSTADNDLFCIGLQSPKDSTARSQTFSREVSESERSKPSDAMGDVTVDRDVALQGVDDLVDSIISFLKANANSKFGPSIKVLLRSLENDRSPETVIQAILTVKQMLSSYE